MTPTLIILIEHRMLPTDWAATAGKVAEVLCQPCWSPLKRVGHIRPGARKQRWAGYKKMTRSVIESYLTDPANHAIVLDSGAADDAVAVGFVTTGVHEREPNRDPDDEWTAADQAEWEACTTMASYVAFPHDPSLHEARLSSALTLASAMEAVSGCITVEPNLRDAERLATSGLPSIRLSELRRKERYAHVPGRTNLSAELSGPEWGVFLGPGHLRRLPLTKIRAAGVFDRVDEISADLAFVALTNDPMDALRDGFDDELEQARRVLKPLLLDVSDVHVDYGPQ